MSNKILIRFASESQATFDKFTFSSETVTYQEIMDFLSKKKKIGSAGKTDQITLKNIDKNIEITPSSGIIDAGTRLLVSRRPPENAIQKQTQNVSGIGSEVIELTYNPKQVQAERQKRQQMQLKRLEMQEEIDYVEPQDGESDNEENDLSNYSTNKIRFKTVKLDASQVEAEFMCELNNKSIPLHFISVPMLATCCGHSACFDCLKSYLSDNEKNMSICPFCNKILNNNYKLIHNKWLHQLLEFELPKDTDKLTAIQREALSLKEGKHILDSTLSNLKHQMIGAKAEDRKQDESKHELFLSISDDTCFYVVRLPNQDCLNQGLSFNELPLIEKQNLPLKSVLFVTIQNQTCLSAVCMVESLGKVAEHWQKYWAGSFQAAYKVKWLLRGVCNIPFHKLGFLLPQLLRSQNGILQIKYGHAGMKDFQYDLLQKIKQQSIISIDNACGQQIAKLCVDWKRTHEADYNQGLSQLWSWAQNKINSDKQIQMALLAPTVKKITLIENQPQEDSIEINEIECLYQEFMLPMVQIASEIDKSKPTKFENEIVKKKSSPEVIDPPALKQQEVVPQIVVESKPIIKTEVKDEPMIEKKATQEESKVTELEVKQKKVERSRRSRSRDVDRSKKVSEKDQVVNKSSKSERRQSPERSRHHRGDSRGKKSRERRDSYERDRNRDRRDSPDREKRNRDRSRERDRKDYKDSRKTGSQSRDQRDRDDRRIKDYKSSHRERDSSREDRHYRDKDYYRRRDDKHTSSRKKR